MIEQMHLLRIISAGFAGRSLARWGYIGRTNHRNDANHRNIILAA